MNLLENVRVALRALSANKVRSTLTMLGIIIGVGAVVALLSIGQGASQMITGQVEGLGSNMIAVMPARVLGDAAASQNAVLYYEDYEVISRNNADRAQVAPTFQSYKQVQYAEKTAQYAVSGVTPEYAGVNAYQVAKGRFISASDQAEKARVAVLGWQTAQDLFGNINPLGRRIQIGDVNFDVVGVLESKGGGGFGTDDLVLIPLETGYTRLFGSSALQDGQRIVSNISLSAASPEAVEDVMAQVKFLLLKQHGLSLADEPDFLMVSQNQFLDMLDQITGTLTTFLAAIAAISLLVGGIGIMNIMLVSVSERTREIGLRKAVGARRRTILMQFLIETATLSTFGGLLGIALGVGVALIFTATGLITAQITLGTVLLAFVFALSVGLFFGIYPAYRASSLQPIVALRYE